MKIKTCTGVCRSLGLALVFGLLALPACAAEPGWTSLFNGTNLAVWEGSGGPVLMKCQSGRTYSRDMTVVTVRLNIEQIIQMP